MENVRLYISHDSALFFWRTNPPRYVLEGADRNIRALRFCPATNEQVKQFALSDAEFGPRPYDVLIPQDAPRPRTVLNYHIQKAGLPPRSLYPLRDGIHVVSPELCFVQLCRSLPFAKAVELGMELCGTYALRPDELADKASRDYTLMKANSFKRKAGSWKNVHGLARARQVAPYLVDGSASPMETIVYMLLCLPRHYGGYAIPKPELNPELELKLEHRMILHQEKVKPDLLWRKCSFVIEYDGEYHNDPRQMLRDERRRIVLESMGYTVLTVKKQQVYDPLAFGEFAAIVARRCHKRIRPLELKQQYARENLRAALLGND